ncbi:putative bifunctional diguanylate cyclase/phosphodiesterase [Halomonadaceae bacterium KBTZ08]
MGWLHATGFRARLMLTMLTLVILSSASVAGVMLYNLFEEEQARAEEQLGVAQRVANQVIQTRTELLVSNLEVVARDYGFKSAIGSRDTPTITSALRNLSRRANADLGMIVNAEGRLIANLSGLNNGSPAPFQAIVREARAKPGTSVAMGQWDNSVFQVLVVPLKGAGLRAWLIAGFRLDDSFAKHIANLTATEAIFQMTGGDTRPVLGSSLAPEDTPTLQPTDSMAHQSSLRSQSDYFMRAVPIDGLNTRVARLWLLKDRASALSRYYNLALEMGLVLAVVLAIATAVVLVTARALGRPIFGLARFAQDLGRDRSAQPPTLRVSGEPRILLQSLLELRNNIIQHEKRIEHAATHDSLTGLPNWRALRQRLEDCLAHGQSATVLAVNLPNLKPINEMLGFRFGDETLIATGLRLNGVLKRPGELARTGGSQFMAILPWAPDDELHQTMVTLKSQMETSVEVLGSPLQIQLNLGTLRIPDQARTIDEIQRRLGLTLEQASHATDRLASYKPGGDEEHLREIRLIRDLSDAIEEQALHLSYQPKLALGTGEFVGVEALIRWHHPELGFISPEEFIPLAESSGQTLALTRLVLSLAAADCANWRSRGLHPRLAINLSALDLGNPALAEDVEAHFKDDPQQLSRLTFEVTESAVMNDTGLALQTLEALRSLGAWISVDDFGTGQSSLSQLRNLPVQELKIDKSFVLNLARSDQDQLIVGSTISLAHGLNLTVCAEGIEDRGSWDLLRQWGCEQAQGFFMARPMPAATIPEWADRYRAWAAEHGLLNSGDGT